MSIVDVNDFCSTAQFDYFVHSSIHFVSTQTDDKILNNVVVFVVILIH